MKTLTNKNKQWYILLVFMLSVGVFFSACKKDKDDPKPTISKIPSDSQAGDPPIIENHLIDAYIPNLSVSTHSANSNRIIIQMTGIKEPESRSSYIQLKGTGDANQNIWLQVDGKNKGFLVTKNAGSGGSAKMADIVFTVDNSGSMGSEADTIALQIKNWVNYLNTQNLNLQVGVVGYDGDISGALNFTDAKTLEYYLTKRKMFTWSDETVVGTYRTRGFYGSDSATLHQQANEYGEGSWRGENGVLAIKFAHEYFAFRAGANRIYVNFTDEPNQPLGIQDSAFSVYNIRDYWHATNGTIHTVYSQDTIDYWSDYHNERPWLISEYTGGQVVFVNQQATDLDLNTLPVTGALAETFLLEYMNNEGSGTHDIQVYVKSNQSDADGTRIYKDISYK